MLRVGQGPRFLLLTRGLSLILIDFTSLPSLALCSSNQLTLAFGFDLVPSPQHSLKPQAVKLILFRFVVALPYLVCSVLVGGSA
jgi:hypothetical protein